MTAWSVVMRVRRSRSMTRREGMTGRGWKSLDHKWNTHFRAPVLTQFLFVAAKCKLNWIAEVYRWFIDYQLFTNSLTHLFADSLTHCFSQSTFIPNTIPTSPVLKLWICCTIVVLEQFPCRINTGEVNIELSCWCWERTFMWRWVYVRWW